MQYSNRSGHETLCCKSHGPGASVCRCYGSALRALHYLLLCDTVLSLSLSASLNYTTDLNGFM